MVMRGTGITWAGITEQSASTGEGAARENPHPSPVNHEAILTKEPESASGRQRCSITSMRAASVSSSSSSSTRTHAWTMTGPESIPSSTKCTVQPDTLTPIPGPAAAHTEPGESRKKGRVDIHEVPVKSFTMQAPRIRMYPAIT